MCPLLPGAACIAEAWSAGKQAENHKICLVTALLHMIGLNETETLISVILRICPLFLKATCIAGA